VVRDQDLDALVLAPCQAFGSYAKYRAMKLDVEARTPRTSFRVRAALTVIVLGLGVGAAVGQSGCSNQSEGQRCSTLGDNAGTDDCQSVSSTGVPLICKPKTQLNGAQDDLCCPQNPSEATVPACQAPGSGGIVPPAPSDGGAETSVDSGARDTSTPDTSTPDTSTPDASGDGSADTSTD
jgi:hypothetical protein